ncbi:unnamed protein product [Rotaria socialis]|uniref:3CxxC-type domain-containing protein n=1 Tax=Rotaria socialis TaxID=392032 RepID=A0A818Y3R9_9BILA|nr:unnamed protein product [Rotaria socialis]CAF4756038.1 unnamed protein product [Rotaria socialis]
MASSNILAEKDYQTKVLQARSLDNFDKNIICPNFTYVFYTELEINLNWNFHDPMERWYLLFAEISLPICCAKKINENNHTPVQVFVYPPNRLIIYHNAKIKYRCLNCINEWTSARGRAIFQTEIPCTNKYNCLFVNLCTQECRLCRRNIQPSWYLCETTRVMKSVCRIIIEQFYSNRNFPLPIHQNSSSDERFIQRASQTNGRHHENLCQACREGYCYDSHRKYH